MTAVASAEFVVDSFTFAAGDEGVAVAASTSGDGTANQDTFGNDYSGVTRTVTYIPDPGAIIGGFGVNPAFNTIGLAVDDMVTVSYDFSGVADTTSLGYYAQNFRFEGVNISSDHAVDVSVVATSNTAVVGTTPTQTFANGDTIYFDLTTLSEVGVLNDLAEFTIKFTANSNSVLLLNNASLIATPEPTSLISLGSLACLGFVSTLRRRRKEVA